MKTSLFLALCLPLAAAACSVHIENDEKSGKVSDIHVSIGDFDGVKGNGKQTSQTRTVAAVKAVESTGAVDVEIRIGATPSLTVEGDENLLALITTEQVGDRLVIKTSRGFSTEHPLKVVLVTPTVASLTSTGSGDINLQGLAGGDLNLESTGSGDITLSGKLGMLTARLVGSGDLQGEQFAPATVKVEVMGSGDVQLGSIDVESFEASVQGSGSVEAAGSTKRLKGKVMGSGDLNLETFKAQTAELELLGSGDISAYASDAVVAHAAGSGSIVVHGNPAKQQLTGENASLAS